ncbi:MAG: DUF423 domain-containing protein [Deltaproteobacteria bacterium]|nr:DUF423 domain-containing protein [Deltaproteobacteria bacterium]
MVERWISTGALLMAAAVAMGAFGAHSLKEKLDAYYMGVYEKAVFYHIIHALSIILVAMLVQAALLLPGAGHKICLLFFFGITLFSMSLYALALTKIKWLGMITPIGGTMLIVGWILLGIFSLRTR